MGRNGSNEGEGGGTTEEGSQTEEGTTGLGKSGQGKGTSHSTSHFLIHPVNLLILSGQVLFANNKKNVTELWRPWINR